MNCIGFDRASQVHYKLCSIENEGATAAAGRTNHSLTSVMVWDNHVEKNRGHNHADSRRERQLPHSPAPTRRNVEHVEHFLTECTQKSRHVDRVGVAVRGKEGGREGQPHHLIVEAHSRRVLSSLSPHVLLSRCGQLLAQRLSAKMIFDSTHRETFSSRCVVATCGMCAICGFLFSPVYVFRSLSPVGS